MESFQVKTLLDPEPEVDRHDSGLALDKLASLLGADPYDDNEVNAGDVLKTASVMEKLGRALESGQAQLDTELRELFGGEETDDDIKRHNEIEDDYLKHTGQPGV